jgi:C4-dicarboxylate transporter
MLIVLAAPVVVATIYSMVRGTEVRLAFLAGGSLGRSISPVAANTAIEVGCAGGSIFDIAERTAVPAVSAAALMVIILGFIW